MKIYNLLNLLSRKTSVPAKLQLIVKRSHVQYVNTLERIDSHKKKRLSLAATNNLQKHSRKIHEVTSDSDELIDLDLETELELESHNQNYEQRFAKNLLYNDVHDPIVADLKSSASVQDVLNIYNQNKNAFSHKHAVQSVLVLSDLQNIYNQVTDSLIENKFLQQLKEKKEFLQILKLLENRLHVLNSLETIHVLHHLCTLGVDICGSLPQLLIKNVKNNLLNNFCLPEAATFFRTIFKDVSLRPFLVVQELLPFVIERIESCPIEEFEYLTLCLSKVQRIVTYETVQTYQRKVLDYIDSGELTGKDKTIILRIISFLGLPAWRDDSTAVISKCMLLLQGHLNTLNPDELILLYDIFFKTKEPGELLNEIQRRALTYLHKNEDDVTHYTNLQLKLFLSLLCFLSPLQRIQYQKVCRRYVYYSTDYNRDSLFTLAKILSYIRTSDNNLCEILWKNMTHQIKQAENEFAMLRLCQNYINFHADLNNYRYPQFERDCMLQLKKRFHNSFIQYIPARVCNILAFALIYGNDKEFLDTLVTKLENNWEQVNSIQCLILSQSIKIITATPNRYSSRFQLHRINKVIDKVTEKELGSLSHNRKKAGWLLKSCVLRNSREDLALRLFDHINNLKVESSRTVENVTYCLWQVNVLHKEVLNQCIYYIVHNKAHILGYEAERILYLCYYLGYQPENIDQFIDVVINLVIRDQERLTGLTLLQTALALCFYNKLPQYFIKLIFNVEFLDKLDGELANCYSKDKYPQRVRNKLMQLNRAVCLLYPEANVPWFHEKYTDVVKNQVVQGLEKQKMFPYRVKTYLSQVLEKPEYINEHVITPYGYHVDFEINLNDENNIVMPGSEATKRKLAVLLLQPNAFTKLHVQLKGKYQLMRKHLEILGYEVVFVSFTDWMNLVYAGERIEFLSDLIWPKRENLKVVTDR